MSDERIARLDPVDLRVSAILDEGFREARGPFRDEPDDRCECGHVRDEHGFWRGGFECECKAFEEVRP